VRLATVSGQVLDANGRPVRGARIYFASSPGYVADISALTDADGRFTLTAKEPGAYGIGVAASGYDKQEQRIEIAAGKPVTLSFRLGVFT
jgi:protocatechuate 3,4-dioxygenase beta subunit